MSDSLLKEWKALTRDVEQAKKWEALKEGIKYQSSSFNISMAHCKRPLLMRCGQESAGGKNYWEIPDAYAQAVLEVIVADWDCVSQKALKIMKDKERSALLACQEVINDIQSQIDNVGNCGGG